MSKSKPQPQPSSAAWPPELQAMLPAGERKPAPKPRGKRAPTETEKKRASARAEPMPPWIVMVCRSHGIVLPVVDQVTFAPPRRWRFDFAWPGLKLAYEREGGTFAGKKCPTCGQRSGGRHNRGAGYAADCEKYSTAATLGWCVIRATTDMERSGLAARLLDAAVKARLKS